MTRLLCKTFLEEISSKCNSELLGNKTCGTDNIPPKILKLSASTIKEPPTNLINYCILDKGGKFLKKLWCCVGGSIAR